MWSLGKAYHDLGTLAPAWRLVRNVSNVFCNGSALQYLGVPPGQQDDGEAPFVRPMAQHFIFAPAHIVSLVSPAGRYCTTFPSVVCLPISDAAL